LWEQVIESKGQKGCCLKQRSAGKTTSAVTGEVVSRTCPRKEKNGKLEGKGKVRPASNSAFRTGSMKGRFSRGEVKRGCVKV